MAIAGIYYIDTLNFADATAVYSDEALTTFAPDGFYQMGGISAREQVSGILKPAENCPACTTPIPDATPVPNNAYSVKDTVTGNFDHVILNTNFNLQTEVTTSINTNCWLIIAGVVQSTANTITGQCIRIPDADPLYYQLNICPVSSSNDAPSSIYVNENQAPTASQFIYLNTTNSSYYSYNDIAPVTIPLSNIPIVTTIAQTALTACPDVPPVFTYWNAQQCTDPNNTIVIQAPENTSFTEGTTSVKINGSETCYQITTQRIGSATTFDGIYAGTAYTGCTSGASPCIPTAIVFNSFVATNIDTSVAYDVQIGNGRQGDQTQISAATGCYELGIQTTRTTNNVITSPCVVPVACVIFGGIAGSSGGTLTYKNCATGINVNESFSAGEEFNGRCGRVNTMSFSGGNLDISSTACNENVDIPSDGDYFLATPCSGGTEITVYSDFGTIPTGAAVTTTTGGNTCFVIGNTSSSIIKTNKVVQQYSNCQVTECDPPVGACGEIRELSITYNSLNVSCPSGQNRTIFGDNTTLALSTKIYQTPRGCEDDTFAPSGTYVSTVNGVKTSRYWNGNQFTSSETCVSNPDIRATITEFNVVNLTGSSEGVGYEITGSGIGTISSGPSPLSVPGGNNSFDTAIVVNEGFSIANSNVSYTPTSITNSQNITVVLSGQITEDTPNFTYAVTTCGNLLYRRISSTVQLSSNSVIVFRLNNSNTNTCGTVRGITGASAQGEFIENITSSGCFNNQCASNDPIQF